MVLFIIGSAAAFGWLMAYLRVPAHADRLHAVASPTTRSLILLMINVLLLLLGTFMDMAPLIIITHADLPAGGQGLSASTRCISASS